MNFLSEIIFYCAHFSVLNLGEVQTEGEKGSSIFDRYPPVYSENSDHWLVNLTLLEEDQYTIEFEDGSIWAVNIYDGMKVSHWSCNAPLTITQNNRSHARWKYRIINKRNGQLAEANLLLPPTEKGPYSHFIVDIDLIKQEIILNDQTRYQISDSESTILKDWARGEYVVIGTDSNTTICQSHGSALLINANTNNDARAKKL